MAIRQCDKNVESGTTNNWHRFSEYSPLESVNFDENGKSGKKYQKCKKLARVLQNIQMTLALLSA